MTAEIDIEAATDIATAWAKREVAPYVVNGGPALLSAKPIERPGFWLFVKHPDLVLSEIGEVNAGWALVVTRKGKQWVMPDRKGDMDALNSDADLIQGYVVKHGL